MMQYQRIHIQEKNKSEIFMLCNNRHKWLFKYKIIKDKKFSNYYEMKRICVEIKLIIKWMSTNYLNYKVKMKRLK